MKSIFKYTLETTGKQVVKLPKEAEILTIQTQFEEPQLWALVNPENEPEERTIEIFGTGHPVHCDMGVERKYISTYQLSGGNYVVSCFRAALLALLLTVNYMRSLPLQNFCKT